MKLIKTKVNYILFVGDKPIALSNVDKTISVLKLFGVNSEDIEASLTELVRNDHEVAEFGDVNKTFLFTRRAA